MGQSNSIDVFEEGQLEEDFRKAGGTGSTNIFSLFRAGYDDLVNSIIRPKRKHYTLQDLGPKEYKLTLADSRSLEITRQDMQILNSLKLNLAVSIWQSSARYDDDRPCLLYLHSNLGSRLDVRPVRDYALRMGFSVVAFDFTGSGLSDGIYCTVGHQETKDVASVVSFLKANRTQYKISKIVVFGHSMGAVAALRHAAKCPQDIDVLVLDGAYASLKQLADELVNTVRNEGFPAPSFVAQAGARLIRSSVQSRAGFDLTSIKAIDSASKCHMPALLINGKNDKYVQEHHGIQISRKYKGPLYYLRVESDHYGRRDEATLRLICCFLYSNLDAETMSGIQDKFDTPNSLLREYPTAQRLFQDIMSQIQEQY